MFFKMFQEVFLLCFSIYMLLFQRKKYELSPPRTIVVDHITPINLKTTNNTPKHCFELFST